MSNTKRLYAGLLAGLIFTIVLAALAPQASAQGITQKVEIVGSIEAVAPGLITVNGMAVNVTGAEIKTSLTIGRLVKVEGFLFDDGVIRAYELDSAERDDDRDQLEIVGALEAIAAGQMTVAGMVFDVSRAEVTPGLAVGDRVKVHASQSTTGQWVAREVERFVASIDDSATNGDDLSGAPAVVSSCLIEIKVSSANLRTGPGPGYDVQGYVLDDEKYPVTSVHSSGAWLQVATAAGSQGWIAASVGELYGPCIRLGVATTSFRGSDDDGDDDRFDDSDDDDRDDSGGRGSDDSDDDDRVDDNGSDDSNDDSSDRRGDDDDHDDDRNDDDDDDHDDDSSGRGSDDDDDHDDDHDDDSDDD